MEKKQDERLGTEPLGRLIVSLALPAVAAQLINVLYNIIDRIYIHFSGTGPWGIGVGQHPSAGAGAQLSDDSAT